MAIDLPGGPAFVDALRRVWDDGDAALPLDQRLAGAARSELLDAMAPGAVVDHTGRTRRPAGVPVEEGDALVVSTSGTTGRPRGVVLTHAAVTASALATSRRLGVDAARHRWLACLPLSHVGGLSVVTRALLTGAALTVHPGFDAGAVMAAAGPEVLVSLVPTTLARVEPGRFHTVVLGGSAPPADLPGQRGHHLRPHRDRQRRGLRRRRPRGGRRRRGCRAARSASGGPCSCGPTATGPSPPTPSGWYATGDAGSILARRPAARRRPAVRSDRHRRRQRLARLRRSRPAPPPRRRSGRGRPVAPTRSGASGWWHGSFPPPEPYHPRSTSFGLW